MKSVIEEAASLGKAIEQGWNKAGQPIEFKVKILEKPKKKFLGLTTAGAKIGIFFEDASVGPRKDRTDTKRRYSGRARPRSPKNQPSRYRQQSQERSDQNRAGKEPNRPTSQNRPKDRQEKKVN